MEIQDDRVQTNSPEQLNEKIEIQLLSNIQFYSKQDTQAVSKRIKELEKEWYVDRVLITNASAISIICLFLGLKVDKRWFILSGAVAAFLLQHGIQGWCPPLLLFRKLGIRSFKEIDRERFALKYLRGDFKDLIDDHKGHRALYEAISK